MILDKCDKCKSDILMGECSCGRWYEKGKHPKTMQIYEQALLEFNKSGRSIFSADHHTGSCFVFFKGGYSKVQMVVNFIESIESILKEQDIDGMKVNFIEESNDINI